VLNLPNSLTIVRILTIPAFLMLLTGGYPGTALAVFVAGGITDALDGAIARLTDRKTEFGAMLDPLADKLLLLSSFCVLALMGVVPAWLTVLVIIRDVILLSGYFTLFLFTGERMAVRPSAIGKATTFLQLASVTVVLIGVTWPRTAPGEIRSVLFIATGAATALSGLQYMVRGLAWLQARGTGETARPAAREIGAPPAAAAEDPPTARRRGAGG
jgi:cardiolipin synthase